MDFVGQKEISNGYKIGWKGKRDEFNNLKKNYKETWIYVNAVFCVSKV